MFRDMRRAKQKLPQESCEAILSNGTYGVLAVLGDEGYPYAVPLNYVYQNGRIVFHSAKMGHKVDALTACDKASFCVVDKDTVVPEEYTTYFRSVIAFGRVRTIDDPVEKRAAIDALARKYHPTDTAENRNAAIDREWAPLRMYELKIEHLSGKEAIELVRAKHKQN